MKKYRILSLLLVLVMIFSIGCSSKVEPVQENEVVEKTVEEPVVTDNGESTAVAEAAIAYLVNKPSDSYLIGTTDLFAKIDAGEEMILLDIRQNDVYSQSHIKGAVNVPWGPGFMEGIANIPADKTIYLNCYSGQTAGQTVALLNILGYDAKSIKYGWNFGISQTEGYEAYSEAEASEFQANGTIDYHPEVFAAIDTYFKGLADVDDGMFKNYKISEDNAYANLDNEGFYYLSIRKQSDYDAAHIPGAKNIPYGNGMTDAFDILPMDKTIVVNCYSGQTAGQTVAALKLLGFDAVSLNGGMGTAGNGTIGWTKHYDAVSTIAEAAADVMNNKADHSYLIATTDVFTMMDNQDDMFILDIRQNDVYSEAHLKGAVNVPWGPEFAASIENLPVDKPILVNCYSGQTAGQTVGVLNALGYDARSIKYGWNFGISQTEGFEAYTETELNDFGTQKTKALSEHMKLAAAEYYMGLSDVVDTIYKNYKISEENAFNAIGSDVIFVDIRNADDYAAGHISGAINIPYGNTMIAGIKELPMDQKIIVNCYSGQTAGQTVAIMKLMGYDAVSVNGGMGTPANNPIGYNTKGFELVQ
ncbi:MAG: rhodanese-like domain-containing protein [Clostridiales bacterium]|nr:rhodanese-like domain-containing protein [Clostridiales bacterium]